MATFPTIAYSWQDLTEDEEPVVDRAEMERGIAKQRLVSSDRRRVLQITAHFDTHAEHEAFRTWVKVNGLDFFDYTPPNESTTVQARIPGGQLGPRRFLQQNLQACTRTFQIEWWSPAW